ncbi:MAG: HAD-IA family hydrolase [Actinomycetota bacterium]|nr:HAD-IA family hydrolase [Actinomycetota bacterium]MDA3000812.1 HAD-IA family hydrolase [Actinomycetota bacterium]
MTHQQSTAPSTDRVIRAVLWDFGGVILSSPFEAFNRYEEARGLPANLIRSINATDPDTNAWARFERSEISALDFDIAFADEARALGFEIRGADVLSLLRGKIRDEMVTALDLVRSRGFLTACLTNNMAGGDGRKESPATDRDSAIEAVMQRFDAVIESSKVGVRKPEVRFYEIACETLDVRPTECVFLDDLGVNLKPAAALGMATIKVVSADQALGDLEAVLGFGLRTSTT